MPIDLHVQFLKCALVGHFRCAYAQRIYRTYICNNVKQLQGRKVQQVQCKSDPVALSLSDHEISLVMPVMVSDQHDWLISYNKVKIELTGRQIGVRA